MIAPSEYIKNDFVIQLSASLHTITNTMAVITKKPIRMEQHVFKTIVEMAYEMKRAPERAVLEELMLAMTDKLTRFDMTKAIISRKYTMKIEQPSDDYARARFISKDGLSDHGYVRTVFGGMGGYIDSEYFFTMNPKVKFVHEKNGIEVLGLEPNATGHTYSKKCSMTIKELKECCKVNGIKCGKLDKVGLIRALMKVPDLKTENNDEFPVVYE